MPTVFIGIGSNLGDRESHFSFAKEQLSQSDHVRNLQCSPVYETEPVEAEGGKYWNAVWSFETDLGSREVLGMLQQIEKKSGRVRRVKNEARCLDLDLLFYDELIIRDEDLTVPHPRIQDRGFVLAPFCDLAPEWKHPVLKKTIKELLFNEKHSRS